MRRMPFPSAILALLLAALSFAAHAHWPGQPEHQMAERVWFFT